MSQPAISLASRLRPSDDTLSRELDGELVFLQLETEAYFGLDEVGSRMWDVLCESDSVELAIAALLDEFEVDRETLERDVLALAGDLVARKLLVVE